MSLPLTALLSGLLPPKPDPRVESFFLMQSWHPTAFICLAYILITCFWRSALIARTKGKKKLIKNGTAHRASNYGQQQNPQQDLLKFILIFYNFSMVCLSGYLVISAAKAVIDLGYGLGCVEIPNPADRRTDRLIFLGYLFYFSKLIELLDTVFFLCRGRVDQVTFLHVFHHAAMPPSIWWGLKYAPGGITYMFPLANSFIHVIMYTYYGLAAAGLYKYLWWKNYLTIAQMVQFVILIVHQGQIFIRSEPCDYPKVFPAAIIFYATVFLILFGNFYVQAYWRKQRLAKRSRKPSESGAVEMVTMANGDVTPNRRTLSNGHVLK
ncbi:unnamed protein product [Dicrocoelium dendriticum]|nr:unnamed protein product [Dicrocoelium dendriticum]